MLLLAEGQTSKAWEPSRKRSFFGNRKALDRRVHSVFFFLKGLRLGLILHSWNRFFVHANEHSASKNMRNFVTVWSTVSNYHLNWANSFGTETSSSKAFWNMYIYVAVSLTFARSLLLIMFQVTRVYLTDRPKTGSWQQLSSDGWTAPWPCNPQCEPGPGRNVTKVSTICWCDDSSIDLTATSFYYQAQQFESRAFISSTNVSSEMTNEQSRMLNVSHKKWQVRVLFYRWLQAFTSVQ